MIRAGRGPAAAAAVGLLLVSGACSREPSVPSLPESLCWGVSSGRSVEPLLPNGASAQQRNERPFDVFEQQSNTFCSLFVDDHAVFIVYAVRRNSGRGSDWNGYARKNGTPVRAGDEGFVWDRGAGAVFLCERPDLPRGPALPPSQKYVELELSADRAPRTPRSREILTSLLQRYAEFARRMLKCRNT